MSRLIRPLMLAAAVLVTAASPLRAQERAPAEWKGYAGAGAIAFPKYSGGRGTQTIRAPLFMFEYKETFYVDLVRAGVRLWSSQDRSLALGLAAEPRAGSVNRAWLGGAAAASPIAETRQVGIAYLGLGWRL